MKLFLKSLFVGTLVASVCLLPLLPCAWRIDRNFDRLDHSLDRALEASSKMSQGVDRVHEHEVILSDELRETQTLVDEVAQQVEDLQRVLEENESDPDSYSGGDR